MKAPTERDLMEAWLIAQPWWNSRCMWGQAACLALLVDASKRYEQARFFAELFKPLREHGLGMYLDGSAT